MSPAPFRLEHTQDFTAIFDNPVGYKGDGAKRCVRVSGPLPVYGCAQFTVAGGDRFADAKGLPGSQEFFGIVAALESEGLRKVIERPRHFLAEPAQMTVLYGSDKTRAKCVFCCHLSRFGT